MSKQINKLPLGILFRKMREKNGLLIRQVAAVTELDQAIISRIENCDRIPTKEQVLKLAGLYNLDVKEIMSTWLAEKMVRDYGDEPFIKEALHIAHNQVLSCFTLEPKELMKNPNFIDKKAIGPDKDENQKPKPDKKNNKP